MSRYYYSRDGTDIQGPISESDLQGMRSAGLLSENTQICEEGTETWQPITFIKAKSAKSHLVQSGRDNGGKYICPQCGSSNIQSVPVLYEAGTSTSISKGRVIGVAGLGTDHLMPAGGMTTTTHRQQTLLAARYSPPRKQTASNDKTAWLFIAMVTLIGVGILIFVTDEEKSRSIAATIFILGGIATIYPTIKALAAMGAEQTKLNRQHTIKLREWEDSFLCQKCGYFGSVN